MSLILTLVASDIQKPVAERHIREISEIFGRGDVVYTCAPVWLERDKAVDLGISGKPGDVALTQMRSFLSATEIDYFLTSPDRRRKKLLLADMDSTIVSGETLDELADFAGIKAQISAITQEAMEGRIDFKSALAKRVSLLKDLPESALHKTLERTAINPGAETLVRVMRQHGATCVLVSGGFTFFTETIGRKLGFNHSHGNALDIEKGKLTGKVLEPILDKYAKVEFLKKYIRSLKIRPEDALTIGDGANDIPMLKAAGMGIGYRPKEAVKQEIGNCIIYGDLTAALYAQGFTGKHLL